MSLLIEVNCFLQSNREVPPSDHEGTPVPDFSYLVCLETRPLINCIHSTDFLNRAVGLLLGPQCVNFGIALGDRKCSLSLSPSPSQSRLPGGGEWPSGRYERGGEQQV